MARNYYCSYCGMELEVSAKALKRKGIVLSLIKPHECDEKFASNLEDIKSNIVETIDDIEKSETRLIDHLNGDKRDKKDIITSIAPVNILQQVKNAANSNPEGSMEEPENA